MTDTGLQPLAIVISIAAPCVAFVFVILRLYTRYFITRSLGWDDGLIVLPMILSFAQAYTLVMGIKVSFIGYHVKDIPVDQLDPVLEAKYNYATQLLYNPILALVKNGMLLFFLHVGGSIDRLRLFIIAILVLNTTMMFAVMVAALLQCVPIHKIFYPSTPGTCIQAPVFYISTAAATILTDVLVVIIPTWLTWNLRMRFRKKLAIIFLLSMGMFVTAISVTRMYFLILAYYGEPNPDATYSIAGTTTSIEVNLAIASACGPFLKPLVLHYFPNFFGRDSTDRYYEYYEDNFTGGPDVLYRGTGAANSSASASASAKRISRTSSFLRMNGRAGTNEPGYELQSPIAKTAARGRRDTTTPSSSAPRGDEGDDHSSQRAIVTTVHLAGVSTGHGRHDSMGGGHPGQRMQSGIVRQTSVDISYSPRISSDDMQLRQPTAPGPAF